MNGGKTIEPQVSSFEGDEKPIDWIEVLSVLWGARKFIAKVVGVATLVAVVVSLLLPEYYKSTATLLPEAGKSKIASLTGISEIAALAGLNVGNEGSLVKLYPAIVKSDAVLRNVIYAEYQTKKFSQPVSLIAFWEISATTPERGYESALRGLRNELEVSLDSKTNVITLAIETREPQLSADILNRVTKELDEFIRTKRNTDATEQRKWIDNRLGEVKKDLERSENALKEFREKNRRISDSPQLLLLQERLLREMEINTTIYTELKKQYEIAKIEEIKNIPIINVMDEARPAVWKESPRRTMIVLATFFLSTIAVIAYIFTVRQFGGQIERVLEVLGIRMSLKQRT